MADTKLKYPIEILSPTLNPQLPALQDEQMIKKTFTFAQGKWIPVAEPLTTGPENYTDVMNIRQGDNCLEGVQGYTKLHTSAPAYTSIFSCCRAAIQLRTPNSTKSRVIGQFYNTNLTSAFLFQNLTSIPGSGSWAGSFIGSIILGSGLGRFAIWPDNQVVYCNGTEQKIWGGDEMRVGAVLQAVGFDPTNSHELVEPKDFTFQMCNDLQTSDETMMITSLMGSTIIVGTTRPIRATKFYIKTPSSTPTTTWPIKTWDGVNWTTIGVYTGWDSTASFTSTGKINHINTLPNAQMKYLYGYTLYWTAYCLASVSQAVVYKMTADADIQDVNDVWNGETIPVGRFLVKRSDKYGDFTNYVNDELETTYLSIVGGSWRTSHYMLLGFPVPMCGFIFDIKEDTLNSTLASMQVYYCNGASVVSWPVVSGLYDGTAASNTTLTEGGVVFWNPLAKGLEYKTQIKSDDRLYFYKVMTNTSISAGSIWIHTVKGIPAPQKLLPYKFPFNFRNRPMLCGLEIANEGHRVDFGQVDTYAFFNGADSSMGVDGSPLYFGGSEASLTAACEVFNRIGSSLYHVAVFTKNHETYILNGTDAETYQIMKLSGTIGCPAPNSMDTAEIGYSTGQGTESMKCIALWVSHNGPVIFDTTNIIPIWDDIACYFDDVDPRCVNKNEFDKIAGWVDPENMEYNICIPSGSSQTTNNVWLFYDMVNKKWWKKSAPLVPQTITKVTDTDGNQYPYGFFDDGVMRRLDYGKQFDSTDIERYVITADIIPADDVWAVTRLRELKVIAGVASETSPMSIIHIGSGASTTLGTDIASVYLNTSATFIKDTQSLNLLAWSHRLKFTLTGNITDKGLKLMAWSGKWNVERDDK